MKQNSFKILGLVTLITVTLISGCTKKLDLSPANALTNETLFSTVEGYKQVLTKAYSSMAVVGNSGPEGAGDLPKQIITDAGSSDFFRNYWYLQCLSTDEAGWTFNDKSTDPKNIHEMNWTADNFVVKNLYYRLMYTITVCNNFLIESADDKLSSRGIAGADFTTVQAYKQEARFLRAYNYSILMDLFGNPPFATESTPIGSISYPPQISRKDLFAYLETELQSLETTLPTPENSEYGRANRAAAQALLARIYLNAEVYTGTPKYTEAITYCNKVIASGYTLHPKYKELMLADNDLNTDEFIWTLNYDGTHTQGFGGSTFLVHGPAGYSSDSSGLSGSWNCIRFPQQFVDLFDTADIRGQFWKDGQQKNMTILTGDASIAVYGYSSSKFRNKTRTGALAPDVDANKTYSDIDMPIFRLAEIYLTYAEAVVRGGTGGSNATALGYLQQLAVRARPNDANANLYPALTLDYILAERGRELFWEGHRRTDLIRFGKFTSSSYLWAWKGGVASGTGVDNKYNLYPIPTEDLAANPNLKPTLGY